MMDLHLEANPISRRALRFLALCIIFSVILLLIYFNFVVNEIQRSDTLIHYQSDVYTQTNWNDLEDEKRLEDLKITKLRGDSSNASGNANNFHRDLGACKIPKLEVNGTEVIKFYKKFPPLDCEKGKPKPWVFVDEQRRIQATEFALKRFDVSNINCKWAFYSRKNDAILNWTPEEQFVFGQIVEKGDYFKVDCIADGEEWSHPFMVAVPKMKRVVKLRSILHNRPNANQSLNVYILSFDSLSQMSLRRNLPKTIKFLEEEAKSVVFNGYNIVGDGTPQAFIPILTGQTEEELPLTRKRYKQASYVDDVYPFAWRNFSDAGYATMYGEDGHGLGTFTYRLKGFRQVPTDHFPITYFHYTEQLPGPQQCIRAEKQHIVWFRYIESFWREYAKLGIPRFSLMHHSLLSHDDINRVQQVDDDLLSHLLKMREFGALNDSLFIVMADHGARFSELRQTHQGQLEERLPFVSVHLPNSNVQLRQALENLIKNAKNRLATPFDLHATLMDILRWPISLQELQSPNQLAKEKLVSNSKKPPPNRALSLLREIPLNRTCDQAGIEAHWCTCLDWQPESNTADTRILAKAVVKLINEYTEPERALCAPLQFHRVEKAKKLVPNDNLLKYNGILDADGFRPKLGGHVKDKFATYQIVFETTPGNAKYEVTLFYDGTQVTVDWTTISHINQYGDTPHCIIDKNYFMATYCVCYDRIAKKNE